MQELEKTEIITTNKDNIYTKFDDISFERCGYYLYHGIRFQKYLERLESIFKDKKILAGKYIKNYYNYGDNCNKGEYVSLLNRFKTDVLSFQTFILENISLLITPVCNAIETKYVDFTTWEKIKNLNLKHIYSYMLGECMCKDFVPLDCVKAIGVPYGRLVKKRGIEYANRILEDVVLLMNKHSISLPIVDTSRLNQILVSPPLKTTNNVTQQGQSRNILIKRLSEQK